MSGKMPNFVMCCFLSVDAEFRLTVCSHSHWLCWLIGFCDAHYKNTKRTQSLVIATTPKWPVEPVEPPPP